MKICGKTFVIFLFFLIFNITPVLAHGEEELSLAEDLIKERIPCSQMVDDQFELIGEYYMEQMHPGELHELMDERMGGEGSVQLRNMHIILAKIFYCGDHDATSLSTMNIMMRRTGIMGFGSGAGMMDFGYSFSLFTVLYLGLLVSLLVLAVLWIIKLWRQVLKKK